MKILVIGSGGREHAIAWKLRQSPLVTELFCAPGNGGMAQIARNIDIDVSDIEKLKTWAIENKIDFTVVGPELPLSLGISDLFHSAGLSVFGVNQKASQLEASKVFTKLFLKKYGIPTARFEVSDSYEKAKSFLKEFSYPLVIKADGLAQGKGVHICKSEKEALQTLDDFRGKIVLEEFLEGEEISYIGFVDGKQFYACPPSQDYKKIFDHDCGPNTGGMGAYSPVPWVTQALKTQIHKQVIEPLLKGLKKENIDYKGVLYVGLLVSKGIPYVLEFNVRLGDPEAQVLLCKLKSDLLPILQAASKGDLSHTAMEWDTNPTVCVVMASQGYPDAYTSGFEIQGLDQKVSNTTLFHAGTVLKNHTVFTSGGRVLSVVAQGETFQESRQKAYQRVSSLSWKNVYYRKDIGEKLCLK